MHQDVPHMLCVFSYLDMTLVTVEVEKYGGSHTSPHPIVRSACKDTGGSEIGLSVT